MSGRRGGAGLTLRVSQRRPAAAVTSCITEQCRQAAAATTEATTPGAGMRVRAEAGWTEGARHLILGERPTAALVPPTRRLRWSGRSCSRGAHGCCRRGGCCGRSSGRRGLLRSLQRALRQEHALQIRRRRDLFVVVDDVRRCLHGVAKLELTARISIARVCAEEDACRRLHRICLLHRLLLGGWRPCRAVRGTGLVRAVGGWVSRFIHPERTPADPGSPRLV